jgi:hypothetical protein
MSTETPMTGHCLCGSVSYQIDGEPMMTILCHCEDCQRSSGAAYSVNAVFARSALKVDASGLKTFETTGDETGLKRERQFCPGCGSQMFTLLAEMPEMVVVKAGTLDDKSVLDPQMEIFADSAHPWVHNPDASERGVFPRSMPTG